MAIVLRDACDGDIPAIARIQRLCFCGEPTDPRRLGEIQTVVAEYDGNVCGYFLSSFKLIPSHVVVLSLAVHPEYRRIGVGTQLLEVVQTSAVLADRRATVVCGLNLPFALLLESVGFRCVKYGQGLSTYEWGGRPNASALVRRLSRRGASRPLPR